MRWWWTLFLVGACGGRSTLIAPEGDEEGGSSPGPSAEFPDGPDDPPTEELTIVTTSSITFDGQRQLIILDDLEDGSGYRTDVVDGNLRYACDPAFDPEGRVLIADFVEDAPRIIRYDLSTRELDVFGPAQAPPGELVSIVGIDVDAQGRIYGVDVAHHRVFRMDDMDGSGWVTVGSGPGDGVLQLDEPQDVAVGPDGEIVITDAGNQRLVVMDDISGTGWTTWSPQGAPFESLVGVDVDPVTGLVYAVDWQLDRVYRIDVDDPVGQSAQLPSQPTHVAVGPDGRLYLSFLNNLQALGVMDDFDLTTLTIYGGPPDEPLINPCGIAVR